MEVHAHCKASLVFISYLIYFPADTGIYYLPPTKVPEYDEDRRDGSVVC